MKNKCRLFKLPSLWYSIRTAQINTMAKGFADVIKHSLTNKVNYLVNRRLLGGPDIVNIIM